MTSAKVEEIGEDKQDSERSDSEQGTKGDASHLGSCHVHTSYHQTVRTGDCSQNDLCLCHRETTLQENALHILVWPESIVENPL